MSTLKCAFFVKISKRYLLWMGTNYMNSAGNIKNSAWLGNISPVAWQHINLYGRYEFNRRPEPVNMNEIIREMSQIYSDLHPAL